MGVNQLRINTIRMHSVVRLYCQFPPLAGLNPVADLFCFAARSAEYLARSIALVDKDTVVAIFYQLELYGYFHYATLRIRIFHGSWGSVFEREQAGIGEGVVGQRHVCANSRIDRLL